MCNPWFVSSLLRQRKVGLHAAIRQVKQERVNGGRRDRRATQVKLLDRRNVSYVLKPFIGHRRASEYKFVNEMQILNRSQSVIRYIGVPKVKNVKIAKRVHVRNKCPQFSITDRFRGIVPLIVRSKINAGAVVEVLRIINAFTQPFGPIVLDRKSTTVIVDCRNRSLVLSVSINVEGKEDSANGRECEKRSKRETKAFANQWGLQFRGLMVWVDWARSDELLITLP